MILEQYPAVQSLPPFQQRQLAEELLNLTDRTDEAAADEATLALLESRLAAYEANPAQVATWEEVKARVFRRHAS